ncbi:hypothetical protein [Archangium lansingense]|uniref:Lipoprotein n=1 Tax=Archangium lansingense TaxID=2995310 RepID=A0ABT4A576_9BACT|nr:hypothetical protein [Archangium lansinium]MCY1076795.1 hypothetical protein [Archangium lansinium]
MKKWVACMAIAVCGCGGNNLVGTWKGSVTGWDVTVNVKEQVSSSVVVMTGVLSTNKATCFNNATLSGSLAETSVKFGAVGSGSQSSDTVIQIDGEYDGDEIKGYFEAVSITNACNQARTPITLTRQ